MTVEGQTKAQRPDIFCYLDYRAYLRDYFEHLALKNRKYSQRWIAQKAGWKSPQLISMILKGQRKLARENAKLLSMVFALSEKEEEYLLILLDLETASQQDRQLEILDRIRFQFQDGFFKDLPDTGFVYIKKWFYPAVRELASVKNFRVSPSSISEALELSEEEAEEALEVLLKLGVLRKSADATYERSESSLKAADYVSPLLMLQYHLQILERAFKAVQLKRDFRHFDSLIVALPSSQFEAVRQKIQQFIREIDMMGETSVRRDDIFQLSLQFFSLTAGRAKALAEGV